jgi:hypothetical protein
MAGGLEGRLLREKVRGERMANAQQAFDLGRPTGMLQDLGMMQALQQAPELMDIRRMQEVPRMMDVMSQFVDPTELAMDYLRKMGLQGNVQPLPQPSYGDMGMMPEANGMSREELLERIRQLQEQRNQQS